MPSSMCLNEGLKLDLVSSCVVLYNRCMSQIWIFCPVWFRRVRKRTAWAKTTTSPPDTPSPHSETSIPHEILLHGPVNLLPPSPPPSISFIYVFSGRVFKKANYTVGECNQMYSGGLGALLFNLTLLIIPHGAD